jgi:hypothetical protein
MRNALIATLKKIMMVAILASFSLALSPAYAAVVISDRLVLDGTTYVVPETGLPRSEEQTIWYVPNTSIFTSTSASPYVLTEPGNSNWLSDVVGVCNDNCVFTSTNINIVGDLVYISDSEANPVPSYWSNYLSNSSSAIYLTETNASIDISSLFTGSHTASFQSDVETPIPAALPLFATGLGGLGLFGWRRKRKARAGDKVAS